MWVENDGPGSVDNVVLRDDVDRAVWAYSAVWYHEWSGASGDCVINWPKITCALGTIPQGGQLKLGSYTLTYDDISNYETKSKLVVTADLSVENGGDPIGKVTPEKYFHLN